MDVSWGIYQGEKELTSDGKGTRESYAVTGPFSAVGQKVIGLSSAGRLCWMGDVESTPNETCIRGPRVV